MWIQQHHLRQAAAAAAAGAVVAATEPGDLGRSQLLAAREVPNYGNRLNWAIWAFTIASAIFLALRIYCKLSRGRSLWWDDHFLIASWITILVSSAMLTEGTKFGLGLHYQDMDYNNLSTIAWISYGAGFATILGTAWSKTSFALTLLRLPSSRWRKRLVWFIMLSVNVVLGVSATIQFIQCWPVAKLWTPGMEGTCWPYSVVQNYQTFASVYSGTLDIVLALLPWKMVWEVTINKKEKVGALVAMSMGVFSGAISFLKIISLSDISDSSSTTVDIKVFGTAEPAVTIIAVSIPILRAFIYRDRSQRSRPEQFIQLSQNTEPRAGRSTPSIRDSKAHPNEGLVQYTSWLTEAVAGE